MEFSQPLGWISRSADGKFVLRCNADDEEGGFTRTPVSAHSLIPSNHAGTRSSVRSDGSGQSVVTPSHRFHTSSPGLSGSFFPEDLSSVRQPSSVERSFPSTASSYPTPPFPCTMHFRPIHRAQDGWYQQQPPWPRYWLQTTRVCPNPQGYSHRGWTNRPLATSSPPRFAANHSTLPKRLTSELSCSESSGSDHQVTYTRDRLLGAVERVRNAAFHRQHLSVPELAGGDSNRLAAPSRTSVASGSSGHGSKAASLAHSSLQGEFDVNNRSGSSSGFASRNHSAFAASLLPAGGFEADSPHSEPTGHLRQRASTSRVPRLYDGSERGLSDSELYIGFYPTARPSKKYENTEARCAALKEEFLRFRQRQKERQRSIELESTC